MKIHADRRLVPNGVPHVTMLYPSWGKNAEDPADPTTGRFDRYAEQGGSLFQLSPMSEAEVAVLAIDWGWIGADSARLYVARELADQASKFDKKIVIFYWNDSDAYVEIDNSVVFRTSLNRSTRRANEFAMPAWSEDFVERYCGSTLPIRWKGPKPVVGFCGFSAPLELPILSRVKGAARSVAKAVGVVDRKPGYVLRGEALRRLSASSLVVTNLLVRTKFHGGTLTADADGVSPIQSRREYVENMLGSDYILCIRGGGNFSYRLYETLSCGRIPVFVDTDSVLPFDDEIDWKRYSVWLTEEEIPTIADRVAEFHSRMGEDDFVELQRELRRLWEDKLSPMGYFTHLHAHFDSPRVPVGPAPAPKRVLGS